jgi:hypothetical protein
MFIQIIQGSKEASRTIASMKCRITHTEVSRSPELVLKFFKRSFLGTRLRNSRRQPLGIRKIDLIFLCTERE